MVAIVCLYAFIPVAQLEIREWYQNSYLAVITKDIYVHLLLIYFLTGPEQ